MSPTPLRIRVPGSTSNLGPGFDLLGLALGIWLEVRVRPAGDGGPTPGFERLEGEAALWPREGNLVTRAFAEGVRLAGGSEVPALSFEAHSEIPLARGLGSSGAAIAAGLLLGSAWARDGKPLPPEELAHCGALLEGHPDNSTASLFGGCTLALPTEDGLEVLRQEVDDTRLGFAVAWPTRPMSTADARAALPSSVPLADAIENPRRLAFLLEGLRRGDGRLLGLGQVDHLHVPHRLPLLPGAAEALAAARSAGASLATISGSGSTLVAIGPPEGMSAVARAMRESMEAFPENGACEGRAVQLATTAPCPEPWTPEIGTDREPRDREPGEARARGLMSNTSLRVASVQLAPVLLDRERTLAKILDRLEEAAGAGARLVAFPESILPGYPTWLAETGGARFDDPLQKTIHARYLDQAIELPGPELERLQQAARRLDVTCVVGVMERGLHHGRGTLWCTALTVQPDGSWCAHRKLVPTYEERLAWGQGDGHGLRVHGVAGWRMGALNCWENWMPAARLALYGQGEEVHVSLWPGAPALTADISRFTAREGRVFVVASAGVVRAQDVPEDMPGRGELLARTELLHAGGSRIVAPDGGELASLDAPEEGILYADCERELLLAERQNFDPAGHYSRPDVLRLDVNRTRLEGVHFTEGSEED